MIFIQGSLELELLMHPHPIHLFSPRDIPIPAICLMLHYVLRAGVAVARVLVGYPIGYTPKTGTLTGIATPGGLFGAVVCLQGLPYLKGLSKEASW